MKKATPERVASLTNDVLLLSVLTSDYRWHDIQRCVFCAAITNLSYGIRIFLHEMVLKCGAVSA